MTTFEPEYRKFELLPQSQQPPTMLQFKIEEVFETLETAGVDISTAHSMIDPILNRNFGNTFYHPNGSNKFQHTHKNISQ